MCFVCLKDIRRWGVQDRIEETGVLDAWREDLVHDGDRAIRFEVELWFRGTDAKRQEAHGQVDHHIRQLGGTDWSTASSRTLPTTLCLQRYPQTRLNILPSIQT